MKMPPYASSMHDIIDIARARFFPDECLLMHYQRLPEKMRPTYGVFCATKEELEIAQALAPHYDKIKYYLPEDLGVKNESDSSRR